MTTLPLTSPAIIPYMAAHFVLSIDGLTSVSFTKCSGIAGEVGVEEYAEGGENRFSYRLPTRGSSPNLVLQQGAGPTQELWSWFGEYARTGMVAPRDGTVTLMSSVDAALVPVRVWSFSRGWPSKLTGPELDAQASAVAIDAIEISHHGLTLKRTAV